MELEAYVGCAVGSVRGARPGVDGLGIVGRAFRAWGGRECWGAASNLGDSWRHQKASLLSSF
jgi:hypothetical protein